MRVLLATLCAAVLAFPAVLAAATTDTLQVRESDFIALDRSSHSGFIQLEAARVEAMEAAAHARALPNPRLEYLREAYEGDRSSSSFLLSWPWPWDGRRGLRVAAADHAAGAAAERLAADQLSTRALLREIYAEWAQQEEHAVLLAEVHRRIEILVEQQQARADAGEASRLDARRLELAATEIGVQRALAEASRFGAAARAEAWRPELFEPGRQVRPTRPMLAPTLTPTPDADNIEPPLVRASRREVARREAEAKLARKSWESPELTIGSVTDRADGASDGALAYGVAWPLPLLDRGGARRTASDASLRAARASLERAERDAAAKRTALLSNYSTLRAAATAASSATEGLLSTVEAAAESYRLGESSLTDLLGTLQLVMTSGASAIELHYTALGAHRDLELTLGIGLTSEGGSR